MGKLHTNFASRDIEEDDLSEDDLSEDNEESFCNPVSKDNVRDSNFDKALIEFYMKNVSSSLKHAHSKKSRMENADSKVCTRYSGKLFSTVIKALTPKQISVIKLYGMECMLKFVKTDVPLRFVKWIASVFDTNSSEIQLTKKFIPVNKQTIHNILDLPIGGIELVPDCEAGREFLLSHFKVTSIPNVNFFANKLISGEELSDEDIFICFMSVCFTSFLCPNSSLLPSTQYFHIFKDCKSFARYDLSKFVYDWLITSIRSFKLATKKLSKRTITFGGCHYALAVSYLDSVEFGLNSLPDEYPRILVWKGNRIRQYSEMDKNSSNSFGKRPLKRLVPASVYQVIDDIVQIIHTNNIGKPKDFKAWSHSLVCDVLSCLQNSQHAPEPSCSNNSIGNLFQFKFPHGMQNNHLTTRNLKPANNNDNDKATEVRNEGIQEPNKQHNIFETADIPDLDSDIPETEGISKPPMVDSFQANNGKPVPILNEGNGCVVDVNVPVQPDVDTKVLSPIVPIRLSDVFNQQVSRNDFVDLVSVSPEVKIIGECNFKAKYEAMSKETEEAYNKLKKIATTPIGEHNNYISNHSDNNIFKHSASNSIPSSSRSQQNIVPRRYVAPCKRYTDPFVPFVTNASCFPCLPSERRYYSAICTIGKDSKMQSDEAVRYEKAYCSFQSLATLEPYGHIDNYLILCYYRKLFHDKHPSISKKHFFFPYVGETILRYNGNNGDIVQTAFEGANSAFRLWRSDQMQFPIVIANHWFLFAVCLKAKVFAFCDSLYDEGDPFHNAIREPLVKL
ncbi:hypothetical protein ACQ4PT_000013 [Festuca glaucescens]